MKTLVLLLCAAIVLTCIYVNTQVPSQATPSSSYSILGPPTISASHINAILAAYHSPAAGLGQDIYDLGLRYTIDPVFVIAIFFHESRMGTTGEATKTLSPGNERCISDRACDDLQLGGYAQMESWIDGFDHLYSLLYYGYVRGQVTIPIVGHSCTTIDQIVLVYAPPGDHNNVAAYIAAWQYAVDAWRAGRVLL
ncbi:MAG: hypothetical protein ACYDER_07700 [Ktedonobacteraceae bacterium]